MSKFKQQYEIFKGSFVIVKTVVAIQRWITLAMRHCRTRWPNRSAYSNATIDPPTIDPPTIDPPTIDPPTF